MINGNNIPLYENVAGKIIDLVDRGTFNPGDRVPSIRQMSRQFQVSINTVKTAYGFLEDRRIIEARPQSGYYVCSRLPRTPKEPTIRIPEFNPSSISSSELVIRIMEGIASQDQVQFGVAIPNPEFIPDKKLSRMLASETRRYSSESVSYTQPSGNLKLRTQIARRMLKAGCTFRPDEIIITNGASEAVFLALRTLCRPGDTLVVGAPVYFNFLQLIESLGIRIIEIPISPNQGISIEALEMALKQNSVQACLLISNFNNPLGSSIPDVRKKKVLSLLQKHHVPLIEDDINGDLSFSRIRPSVIKSWDTRGEVLLCSSFSKTIAPGYRVGWIAPGRYLDAVKRQKVVTNIATPAPTQMAIAEFLNSGGYEHHLRSIRKTYETKTRQMAEAVGIHFPHGTRVSRPQGGFTLWVELPEASDSLKLFAMAEKKGISIAPGHIFSTTGNYNHCLRLNTAFWSEKTAWAVEALGRMAKAI